MQNFAFEHEGQTYWYSRSVATVGYVFAYSKKQRCWCVLANKRGPGCPTERGKWNVPCGYLEHNMTAAENCVKEIMEETGILIKPDELKFLWIHTIPGSGKQNVNINFIKIFRNLKTEDFYLTSVNSEKDEVEEIKWIPIRDLDNYNFAFKQRPKIDMIASKYLECNFLMKIVRRFVSWLNCKLMFKPIL